MLCTARKYNTCICTAIQHEHVTTNNTIQTNNTNSVHDQEGTICLIEQNRFQQSWMFNNNENTRIKFSVCGKESTILQPTNAEDLVT